MKYIPNELEFKLKANRIMRQNDFLYLLGKDGLELIKRNLIQDVLYITNIENQYVLDGKISGKHASYVNVHNEKFRSLVDFLSRWFLGFYRRMLDTYAKGPQNDTFEYFLEFRELQTYMVAHLCTYYLNYKQSLEKEKPIYAKSIVSFRNRDVNYELLITPRFGEGKWENDKSEIRLFKPQYWSIGHILKTGLCYSGKQYRIPKRSIRTLIELLWQFEDIKNPLPEERRILEIYVTTLNNAKNPSDIPILFINAGFGNYSDKAFKHNTYMLIDSESLVEEEFVIANKNDCATAVLRIEEMLSRYC
jgi:hypothetical protein